MRRFFVPFGLGSLLVVALAGAAPGPPATSQALALIEAYNARSFGNLGWRRVRLELKNGDVVTRTLTVANVWRQEADGAVRMLFALERPEGLKGTNYLLIENPRVAASMQVFLNLPAGNRRVLTIQPSHFDEGLLGSDFGYRDLRMKIPTAGFELRLLSRRSLRGQNAWAVEAVPVSPEARRGAAWGRSIYYLAEKDPVLLGADHFQAAADPKPVKEMRVHGLRRIDGAWTETKIVMAGADRRSSVLSLEDFRATVPGADVSLFVPELLPTVADRLAALRLPAASAGSSP